MSSVYGVEFVHSPFVGSNEPVTGSVVSGSTTYIPLDGPGNYTVTANVGCHFTVGYQSASYIDETWVVASPTQVVTDLPSLSTTWRSGSEADMPLSSGERAFFTHRKQIPCGLVVYGLDAGTFWVLKS